ncbi:zinc-ribbon domain-containing protein [Leisingera sp. ANG-DT]|uniref:zinc-ribbon domain-containing protein n=1 Tax=Leisingera sp. ANG-DT TaxID=1577897 RepID=UPI00057D9945|nr:zinc-ribbon domain-containing protein [Leisingera sp. ANG-DT]KIC16651.1 thioredoxin [Leisingera sp. ANG-DT]
MRLTCPNCAAQYEVPEDVIPPEGRDVQCSNCGQTWFQAAAGADAAEDAALENIGIEEAFARAAEAEAKEKSERELAAKAEQDAEPEPEPQPEPEPEPETGTSERPAQEADPEEAETAAEPPQDSTEDDAAGQPGADEDISDEAPEPEPEQALQPPQRGRSLDPEMSDILREEAAREAELRAAESQSLETQPDLGLEEAAPAEDEAARRSRQARDRMARMRGEDPRQIAAAESGSRKELLPDIEEINSTLRSAGSAAPAPQADPEALPVPRKSSFARGFALSVIAALILLMIYDKAPLIAEKLPQADPVLSSYVDWVDQARLWLDNQVKSVTATQ